MKKIHFAIMPVVGLLAAIGCTQPEPRGAAPQGAPGGPQFAVDPYWPKPLKDNWIFGQVAGLTVDARGHVWVTHRPASLLDDEKGAQKGTTRCCVAPPPVMEFDPQGNVVRAWGGKGEGYDWPQNEHGIYVDHENNVWISGNGATDRHILKFTREGKFLLQIGSPGKPEGSNSKAQLGRPAQTVVDPASNELYVADGYGNRRVAVFDAKTGAYKRHWGAYGEVPHDDKLPPYDPAAKPSRSFSSPVHCVRLSRDGLVYVCDRANDRIQVFRKDGTFVREFFVEAQTRQNGSVWDMTISPDREQRYLYVADGANGAVYILSRSDGKKLGSFGRTGRYAGEFKWIHNIDVDSKGNIYTAEVGFGRRLQKFNLVSQ
jgi:DNA-binding beta-propeller fold protein YncE